MSKEPSKTEQEIPYEQLIEQLEGIVDQIEGGELGLEESIKGYEQGIELVKRARMILDRAEQRITELNADSLGEQED
ncbi:MAG: exodeoxyribonuclease VII small subunit [Phycisphaerales bacterium]